MLRTLLPTLPMGMPFSLTRLLPTLLLPGMMFSPGVYPQFRLLQLMLPTQRTIKVRFPLKLITMKTNTEAHASIFRFLLRMLNLRTRTSFNLLHLFTLGKLLCLCLLMHLPIMYSSMCRLGNLRLLILRLEDSFLTWCMLLKQYLPVFSTHHRCFLLLKVSLFKQ